MPKRRGRSSHRGRVTPSRTQANDSSGHEHPVSGRHTPPTPNFRLRPRWHRYVGWLGVLAGVTIAVVNDAMVFSEDLTLLPGGHQELYLLLAVAVAGAFTWFLGLFDRGPTFYE